MEHLLPRGFVRLCFVDLEYDCSNSSHSMQDRWWSSSMKTGLEYLSEQMFWKAEHLYDLINDIDWWKVVCLCVALTLVHTKWSVCLPNLPLLWHFWNWLNVIEFMYRYHCFKFKVLRSGWLVWTLMFHTRAHTHTHEPAHTHTLIDKAEPGDQSLVH